MKSKKWTIQIILLALLMLSVAFFAFKLAYAQEAYVWTDKEDYAPEETVTIYGTGFTPYSTVTVSLTRPDGHIDQWNVAADEYGSFTTKYQLDGITGTYTVTATDGTNTATATFTDGPKLAVQWSDGDCADVKVTASQLTSGKNYYITYTDPDGNVQRTTPTFSGPSAYTEYFVLNITLPKVLGTWTVGLYEVGVTNPKDTATVKIDKMVWTTDSTYTIMKTSFAQGETLYIKAIGLESGKYYNFRLDPPKGGSSIYVFSSYQYVSGTELTGSYVLPLTAETGEWELHVRKADNAAGTSHEGHYVDRYFTVTPYVPPSTATITFGVVSVGSDFTGPVLKVDGVNYTVADLPKEFTWNVDTTHTFTYYSPLIVNGKRYVWTSTSGLSTAQSDAITVPSGGGSVTAYYKTQYYLTVTSEHGVPSGAGWYDEGATAYAGLDTSEITIGGTRYLFVQWSSDASGTNYAQSDPIIMDRPKFAVALWKTQYYLTVVSPYGTTGGQGWYDKYTYAQATVTPLIVPGPTGVRYVFTGWSGNASGTTSPSDPIYMDGPKTAIANWKTQYYLTVKTIPSNITISGEGWYNSSQSVQLTAPTVSGCTFNYWDVDGTSQGFGVAKIAVSMNAPRTATAHYEKYVPPAQVDLTCKCYVTDGSFKKIGSFTTVFTRVNYATYRLSSTKPNAFYYCIQITNPGATGVSGVVLSFKLDPEFVIVGSDPVQVHTGYGRTGLLVSATVSYNLNSGTVNVSSIGAGQTLYVTISMDYKFKGQTFTRSQVYSWVVNHPSNTFSCTLERPVTHQCSATIKDPAEIESRWTGYVQAATLIGLTLTGFGLAFKLSARRGHGKGKFQKFCI